ncbi:T9SS type A sorting domain-containing protein, partial [bacterium]|nr:T9SS type A sorting domain-containing protein [bacterium]
INAENGSGIAVDSQDNLYVVWGEEVAGSDEIHFSISTDGGNTWSGQLGDETLSFSGGNNAYNPDIAIDENDVIHVVWNQVWNGLVDEIHYARSSDGGATWSSQTTEGIVSYPDGNASSYADIEVGPNNELYVAWKEDSDILTTHDVLNISESTDGGDTWSGTTADTPITLPCRIMLYPQFVVSDAGAMHAVWKGTQDTVSTFHYEVYYTGSDDGGASWTGLVADQTVSFDDGNSSNIPNLCTDSQENIIVVWDENYDGDNEIHLSISTDGGTSWSGSPLDEIISYPDDRPAYRPFVIAGIDDMLHVAWNEGTTSNGYYQIHYSRGDVIGGTPTAVTIDLTYLSGSPVPAGGGNIYFDVYAENVSASPQDFDAWLEMAYEGGPPTTVVLRSFTNYQPGWSINRPNMFYPIPAPYPAGNYTFAGKVGVNPNTAWDESSFPFVKEGASAGAAFVPFAVDGAPNPFDVIEEDHEAISSEFVLISAYPNPFNPTTAISIQLSAFSKVNLSVYDISGKKVAVLMDGYRAAGMHEVTFDGSTLSSGVYLAKLTAEDVSAVSKMMLVK